MMIEVILVIFSLLALPKITKSCTRSNAVERGRTRLCGPSLTLIGRRKCTCPLSLLLVNERSYRSRTRSFQFMWLAPLLSKIKSGLRYKQLTEPELIVERGTDIIGIVWACDKTVSSGPRCSQ